MGSLVVQSWLSSLSWKMQTVLLSALRGCDGKHKEDASKPFTRKYRSVILHNAGGVQTESKFMADFVSEADLIRFCSNLDHYPMHWLVHFTHAVEIVGYYHPDREIKEFWFGVYKNIVDALHFNVESRAQLNWRLKDVK